MYCAKCGRELLEGAKFCPECGANAERPSPRPSEPHTAQFRCKGCGSVMQIDPEDPILHCPTCGSSELIAEDKDVTIERMRARTRREESQLYHEVEMGRQQIERAELEMKAEQEKRQEERLREEFQHKVEQDKKREKEEEGAAYKRGILAIFSIVLMFLSAFCCFVSLKNERMLPLIVSAIQMVLFFLSWLTGRWVNTRKRSAKHVVFAVLGILLIPVFIYVHDVRFALMFGGF